MEMIEVKTTELIGPALDWSVAKSVPQKHWPVIVGGKVMLDTDYDHLPYSPSTLWQDCGPLIEKFRFCFDNAGEHGFTVVKDWYCGEPIDFYPHGKTHLIAACRAIVAAKLGDTVSVPKELMQ